MHRLYKLSGIISISWLMVDVLPSTEWMSNSNFNLKFEVNEYLSIHSRCWLWRHANIGTAHMFQILQTDKTRKQLCVPSAVNSKFDSELVFYSLYSALIFTLFCRWGNWSKEVKGSLLGHRVCWCLSPLPWHVHRLLDFTAVAAAGKTDCIFSVTNSWTDLSISQKGVRLPNI